MKKTVFYTEAAFAVGLFLLAFGTAMTAYGDFGISVVVAPAYILHLKVSETVAFFSFGMAEYVLQATVLLLLTVLLRKFRAVWFLSFLTAVIYGLLLDASMLVTGLLPPDVLALRLVVYVLGMLICDVGISLLFRTYVPPEVYELFIKELAEKLGKPISFVKTVYDCSSMAVAVAMSLLFFGTFRGIGIGSVVFALVNGTLIRMIINRLEREFEFRDRFFSRLRWEERKGNA